MKGVQKRMWQKVFKKEQADSLQHADVKRLLLVNNALTNGRRDQEEKSTIGIVFSMDRALQLHALLGSYKDLVRNPCRLDIIYRASSQSHEAAYQEIFSEYAELIEIKRQNTRKEFKPLLIDALLYSEAERVFFLVDDNMFVEPWDLSSIAGQVSTYCVPSLRMGKNLSRCYTVQRAQTIPSVCSVDDFREAQLIAWIWKYGYFDWGYPLSVDGHMFLRPEILAIAKGLEYDSPNRFEERLQIFKAAFSWRLGVCYEKSRLINIPYNRVQTDIDNLHGSVHQEEMLRMWNEGYMIHRRSYYGTVNESAHQELPLRLVKRIEGAGD